MAEPDPLQYDAIAARFETHAETGAYNALYDRPAVLAEVGNVAGKRILDLGCGPGLYLEALDASDTTLIGCDAAPAMVELARQRVPGADIRVHSLEEPLAWLPGKSIDVAVCALTYHHITERVAFLSEVHRVLDDDGMFMLSTHHPTLDWVRYGGSYFDIDVVSDTWKSMDGVSMALWRLPMSQLSDEFAAANFMIERIIEPKPEPEMQRVYPEGYERLMTMPEFIVFRLVKAPA